MKQLRRHFDLQARRRWRDVLFRRLGIERSYKPMALVRRRDWNVNSLLPLFVAQQLVDKRDFTFLQIGAYDGVGDDDLRELVVRHRLCGVLVEPQPEAFRRLEETYRNQPQVTLLNVAIAEENGTRTLYVPRTGHTMVASFDRSHLLRHGISSADIVGRAVPCHTVDSALRCAGLSTVDLIQIDAEGYDFQIIQSIDFARLRPVLLRFEFRHMSARRMDHCLDLLAGKGYRFFVEEKDIIAWQQPLTHTASLM